jgi:hypothetical protein
MGDTITLEDGPYGSYVVRNEDGRSFLVQQDHDFPSIARTFGWSGRFSKRNYGKGHGAEITAARDWLDLNIGIDAEDPGYFEDVEEVWELREDRKWPTQAERSKMPHWQQMAVTRHENEAVLDAIRAGATSKGAIAQRTGLSCFDTTLVLRRLERAGLIEYT